MTHRRQLIFASHNRGKLRELRALLEDLGSKTFEVIGYDDLPNPPPAVEETGETFAANAVLKARAAMLATGLPALADDSGLEVDALDGRPGVHSARFGGPTADDAARNRLLLKALASVPAASRTARFRCAVAYIDPLCPETVVIKEGQCEGRILEATRGQGGFGYDPLFFVQQLGQTFAQCSAEEKNRISHRGRAMALMGAYLAELADPQP